MNYKDEELTFSMKTILIGSVATAVYVIIAASISSYPPPYSLISIQAIVVLLYWPCFIFALFTFLIALWHIFQRKNLAVSSTILLLSLPMLCYGVYAPRYAYLKRYHDNVRAGSEGISEAGEIGRYLLEYYFNFPDRFHYIGDDDQVAVSGFIDYLKSKQPLYISGMNGEKDPIRFSADAVLSPVGEPLIFLLDRHHDGFLRFEQQKRSVNEFADPWQMDGFGYTSAVGVVVRACPEHGELAAEQPLIPVAFSDADYYIYYSPPD